jgi:hypothetical protein
MIKDNQRTTSALRREGAFARAAGVALPVSGERAVSCDLAVRFVVFVMPIPYTGRTSRPRTEIVRGCYLVWLLMRAYLTDSVPFGHPFECGQPHFVATMHAAFVGLTEGDGTWTDTGFVHGHVTAVAVGTQ